MYIDLTVVGSVLGILVILIGAIAAIIKIYNKVISNINELNNKTVLSLNSININLEQLNVDMAELKGYKKDIDKNSDAILLLQEHKVDKLVFDEYKDDLLVIKTQHAANHLKKE